MATMTFLRTNYLTDVTSGVASLFGELVKLATPILTAYHSDLFHDAVWLETNCKGAEFSFYWSCNETGTTIGTDATGLRKHAYRVTISNVSGNIVANIDPVS